MYLHLLLSCIIFICSIKRINTLDEKAYNAMRLDYVEEEKQSYLGAQLSLNKDEMVVNEILMKEKRKDLENSHKKPKLNALGKHFYYGKKIIDKSKVFKILKTMPKGAALHFHETSIVAVDYIINNITYRDNLYICDFADSPRFKFSKTKPSNSCFVPMAEFRESNPDANKYLQEKFTLWAHIKETIPVTEYLHINGIWRIFENVFSSLDSLLTYKPVYIDYMYKALEEFYNDNIQYMEMRTCLDSLYDINGESTSPLEVAGILNDIVADFKSSHPNFIGMRLIYSSNRNVELKFIDEYQEIFRTLKKTYPDFIAGLDLVAQEDLGRPLIDFVPKLINNSSKIKYFFHAGETNWIGQSTDENLVDAVLLNASRIGHGYALTKHPKVMEKVLQQGIAIEICPISNQVLLLVEDLRNHPATVFFSRNYPVVICSDNPGIWNSKALSHDFYMAFMAIASADADLKTLKQLAINSIVYSSLEDLQKTKAMSSWKHQWDSFIQNIIKQI